MLRRVFRALVRVMAVLFRLSGSRGSMCDAAVPAAAGTAARAYRSRSRSRFVVGAAALNTLGMSRVVEPRRTRCILLEDDFSRSWRGPFGVRSEVV